MAEPTTTTAAALLSGTFAAFLTAIGADPLVLFWGFAGGIAFLFRTQPLGRWRALWSIVVAGLVSSALTGFIAHYLLLQVFNGVPPGLVVIVIAFVLGLTSQKVLDILLETVPGVIGTAIQRLRGRGGNGP